MKKEDKIEDFIDTKEESIEFKKISIKEWFDGSIITRDAIVKQLPFILFVSFLGIIYIGNRYQAEKIVRKINKIEKEVKDLRTQSIFTASELMKESRQSEVIKKINKEGLELEESVTPPKKILEY
jgi:hypothetical protein